MRLIDADALEKEFCSGCQYENNKYSNCIDCALAHAPTIAMDDLISRQTAIDGFYEMASDMDYLCTVSDYVSFLESLPSAQPEITLEYAIDYLHSIGWMQEHDLILTEFAQPEHIKCRDCTYAEFKPGATIHCKVLGTDLYQWDYCSYAERRTDDSISD